MVAILPVNFLFRGKCLFSFLLLFLCSFKALAAFDTFAGKFAQFPKSRLQFAKNPVKLLKMPRFVKEKAGRKKVLSSRPNCIDILVMAAYAGLREEFNDVILVASDIDLLCVARQFDFSVSNPEKDVVVNDYPYIKTKGGENRLLV